MIRINLLPVRAAQKKEKLRTQLSIFFLCLILVGVGCGVLYFQKMSAIDSVTAEINSINRRNQELQKKIGQVRDFESKKADLEKKLAVLQQLKAGKTGPVHLMDQLSLAMPDNLWLTQFSEKGGWINVSGIADTEETVALFMKNLEASPYYRQVELAVTEQTIVRDEKMQKFTLDSGIEVPSSN